MTRMQRRRGLLAQVCRKAASATFSFALALLPPVNAISEQAQTLKVLHTFAGPQWADGAYPEARLLRDAVGNFYGTTDRGGAGGGTVFRLNKSGKEKAVYNVADARFLESGLVRDEKGNLYGTTFSGGTQGCEMGFGCGTVFKMTKTGNETILYRFTGGADGANPLYASLVRDAQANLYGTTSAGGAKGFGTVFKLSRNGKETVLHHFKGTDGTAPSGELVRDVAGNLYGAAFFGGIAGCPTGFGCGTIFKLNKAGKETVLYRFTGGADGANPISGLIEDTRGNLYGTTRYGGDLACHSQSGCGVVFKLAMSGKMTTLHSFTGTADGADPEAGVTLDTQGNIYGTTYYGGSGTCNDGINVGCGTVFKVDQKGNETVLYSFTQASGSGNHPQAGLILDTAGNLYGTTAGGGDFNCDPQFGCGIVFQLTR